jgi:hypothetical protein
MYAAFQFQFLKFLQVEVSFSKRGGINLRLYKQCLYRLVVSIKSSIIFIYYKSPSELNSPTPNYSLTIFLYYKREIKKKRSKALWNNKRKRRRSASRGGYLWKNNKHLICSDLRKFIYPSLSPIDINKLLWLWNCNHTVFSFFWIKKMRATDY